MNEQLLFDLFAPMLDAIDAIAQKAAIWKIGPDRWLMAPSVLAWLARDVATATNGHILPAGQPATLYGMPFIVNPDIPPDEIRLIGATAVIVIKVSDIPA